MKPDCANSFQCPVVREQEDRLSRLRHEINNPLTAVLGFTELLLKSGEFSPEVLGELREIREGALQIHGMVQQLTWHVEDQEGSFGKIDIGRYLCR